MSNKHGTDKGDVRQLVARADALLEVAYYASEDSDLSKGIAQSRAMLASLWRN